MGGGVEEGNNAYSCDTCHVQNDFCVTMGSGV